MPPAVVLRRTDRAQIFDQTTVLDMKHEVNKGNGFDQNHATSDERKLPLSPLSTLTLTLPLSPLSLLALLELSLL
jgi:hypothetical protein